MGKIQRLVQDWLGITDLKEMLKVAEVNRDELRKMLVEINESGNTIAGVIDRLVEANSQGQQNEVNRLVQELAPARDFLRELASRGGDVSAVDRGEVVPPLPPVGGEVPPAENPTTQDAVNEAAANDADASGSTAGFSSSPGEPNS